MNNINQNNLKALSLRIESIDVIRGLTILVMIFVNDIAGAPGLPQWLRHMPTRSDGMTFVDLVFPAFLFIVGLSMPFSIGRRLEQSGNLWTTWKHILIRTIGLLIIGFFMVNNENMSGEGIINSHVWGFFLYLSVFIIWNKGNSKNQFLSKNYLKYIAIVLLIVLAFLYRGQGQDSIFQMRPYWWGILGLIGWAYLVACLIYIPFRRSPFALLGFVVLLYCFYMADEAGLTAQLPFIRAILQPSNTLGSHPAIVLSGVILGAFLQQGSGKTSHQEILKKSFLFSLGLFFGGLLLHTLNDIHIMFIISKNLATVPWCLISSAITIWIWIVIYWLIDIKGYRAWAWIIKPAGANPLFEYILAPFVFECFALLAFVFDGFNIYFWLGHTFYLALLRGVVVAFLMTWLAGYLSAKGIRLKL